MSTDANKAAKSDTDSDDAEAAKDAHDEQIFKLLGQPPAVGGIPQTGPGEPRANDPNFGKP